VIRDHEPRGRVPQPSGPGGVAQRQRPEPVACRRRCLPALPPSPSAPQGHRDGARPGVVPEPETLAPRAPLGEDRGMLLIRRATAEDVPEILALVRELARYEKEPDAVVATEADYLRDGFSGDPRFFVELAEVEGEVAGFALWFHVWSTWQGRKGLHLEDLFVRLRFRGRGVGKALLLHLAGVAVAEGCGRFQWQVLDWNEPAIRFYEGLGARALREWIPMRVSGEEIERLAHRTGA